MIKGGANVPAFVLEYLLANTCSTDDEDKIREGIENVKNVLREHYVNPEESTLIQSKLKEHGKYKIIDKISVELDPQRDCYWANIVNSNIKRRILVTSLCEVMKSYYLVEYGQLSTWNMIQ